MVNYTCKNCKKIFNKKSNFDYHITDRKRPCSSDIIEIAPKSTDFPPDSSQILSISSHFPPNSSQFLSNPSQFPPNSSQIPPNSSQIEQYINPLNKTNQTKTNCNFNIVEKTDILNKNSITDILIKGFEDLKNKNLKILIDNKTCIYCDKKFTRTDNLNRHLLKSCKTKKNCDELEQLKIKLDTINNNNNNNSTNENENLKKQNTNTTKIIDYSDNSKNQINNGNIINNNNNNNLTVQLVQFGCENIDNIDTEEALNVYYNSTGGNILSNVLKLVNLNDKYPENHNICITDISREYVRVYNGKKFILRKFKNIKEAIMSKIIKNTHKIVNKIENDKNIKLTPNILSKLSINKTSIYLIEGKSAEDIVRNEIREKERVLTLDDDSQEEIDETQERDFNVEEQIRIDHLENKRQGLQVISYERIKEELYNGKDYIK